MSSISRLTAQRYAITGHLPGLLILVFAGRLFGREG